MIRLEFKSIIFLCLFTFMASTNLRAQVRDELERKPLPAKCSEKLRYCEYTVQNIGTANLLVAKLYAILFNGDILTGDEGFLKSLPGDPKKMAFWINDQAMHQRVLELIPLLDVLSVFNPTLQIEITTEIYALSRMAVNQLQVDIKRALKGVFDSGVGVSLDTDTWQGTLSLTIGDGLIDGLLGSQVGSGEAIRLQTFVTETANESNINFSEREPIFISPNQVNVEKLEAGVRIQGRATVQKSEDGETIIPVIRNYDFDYGVELPQVEGELNRVKALEVKNVEFVLPEGVSRIGFSTVSTMSNNQRGVGFSQIGRSKEKMYSQLVIVTRARIIQFDPNNANKNIPIDKRKVFSKDQREKLPKDKIPLSQVFASLKPYSFNSTTGKVIGFKLDQKLAREMTIDRIIRVTAKAKQNWIGSYKERETTTTSVEDLMLNGFEFSNFNQEYFENEKVKFKFQLSTDDYQKEEEKTLRFMYYPKIDRFVPIKR